MDIADVKNRFALEFAEKANKFSISHFKISEALATVDPIANNPGVYLFWHPLHKVLLVGKHQKNSKKRALEHIRDNTRNDMIELRLLKEDPDLDLYLFNVLLPEDKHWILALEAYFEWNLNPAIRAHRMG